MALIHRRALPLTASVEIPIRDGQDNDDPPEHALGGGCDGAADDHTVNPTLLHLAP